MKANANVENSRKAAQAPISPDGPSKLACVSRPQRRASLFLSLSSPSYVSHQASPSNGEKRIPRSLRYAHKGLNNANATAKERAIKSGGCATKGVYFDERLRDWQDIAQGYKEGASQ